MMAIHADSGSYNCHGIGYDSCLQGLDDPSTMNVVSTDLKPSAVLHVFPMEVRSSCGYWVHCDLKESSVRPPFGATLVSCFTSSSFYFRENARTSREILGRHHMNHVIRFLSLKPSSFSQTRGLRAYF